jgi:hypothetical protein
MDHSLDVNINDLELSHRIISLNNFSIPGDKSGEPQKEILGDDLLLLFSISSCLLMTLGLPLLRL